MKARDIEVSDEHWELAIKFNNTDSRTNCPVCKKLHGPGVGYQVTLRDTMDILCDFCVEDHGSALGVARLVVNNIEGHWGYWKLKSLKEKESK